MSLYVSLPEVSAKEYVHSGHMPTRGSTFPNSIELAYVPKHLSRRLSWLRLGLRANDGSAIDTVVLDRKAARQLRDQLSRWLDNAEDFA